MSHELKHRWDGAYSSSFEKAVDGAVIDLNIDLGFDMRIVQRFRLDKVNVWGLCAPYGEERKTAFAARAFVTDELSEACVIEVHSCRKENDIYFADIFYKKAGDKKWRDLSKALIKRELGVRKLFKVTNAS